MIDTTIVFLICVGVAFLSALCLSVPYLIREQERDEESVTTMFVKDTNTDTFIGVYDEDWLGEEL